MISAGFSPFPGLTLRGWVLLNYNAGAPVIVAGSGLVNAVANTPTAGGFRVTFAAALPDANYIVSGLMQQGTQPNLALCVQTVTANGCDIWGAQTSSTLGTAGIAYVSFWR